MSLENKWAVALVIGVIVAFGVQQGWFDGLMSTIGFVDEYPLTYEGFDVLPQSASSQSLWRYNIVGGDPCGSTSYVCANDIFFPSGCTYTTNPPPQDYAYGMPRWPGNTVVRLDVTCNDNKWQTKIHQGVTGTTSFSSGSSSIILTTTGTSSVSLVPLNDFYGYDTEAIIQVREGSWNGFIVDGKKHKIEVLSSRLDPSQKQLLKDGIVTSEGDGIGMDFGVSGDNIVTTVEIFSLDYRMPFGCELQPGEFLVYELVESNQAFGLLSSALPIQKFCLEHPVIIFDQIAQGTTQTAEPYTKLAKGEAVSIPANQVWGIFYVARNDGNIPASCDPTSDYYNVELGICTQATGLATVCAGTLDPVTGICSLQVYATCDYGSLNTTTGKCDLLTNAICDYGFLNTQTGKCNLVMQYFLCPGFGATYRGDIGKCILPKNPSGGCDYGYQENPGNNYCEAFPLMDVTNCEPPFAYDPLNHNCLNYVESVDKCDYIYNSTDRSCTKPLPVVEKCMADYNATSNECSITQIPTPKCDGEIKTSDGGVVVCEYYPTRNLVDRCPQGAYNNATKVCDIEVNAPEKYRCNAGFLYNMTSRTCDQIEVQPPPVIPPSTTSYTWLWIVGAGVVAYLIATRKKK